MLVQRKGDTATLLGYVMADAPIFEKHVSVELLTEHLKSIYTALNTKTKFVNLTAGVNDSVLRQAEMPQMPVEDMRLILKNNTKSYLQQDLPNHVFDCWLLPSSRLPGAEAPKPGTPQKNKVIVGGARKQFVDEIQTAIKQAGLVADQLIPGLLGPIDAFEIRRCPRHSPRTRSRWWTLVSRTRAFAC